jgi:hypothetical protein
MIQAGLDDPNFGWRSLPASHDLRGDPGIGGGLTSGCVRQRQRGQKKS